MEVGGRYREGAPAVCNVSRLSTCVVAVVEDISDSCFGLCLFSSPL